MPRVVSQATHPMSTPKATNQGSTVIEAPGPSTSAIAGTLKEGKIPKKVRPMQVAVTLAIPTHSRLRGLMQGSINSAANATPPIGVLNVAAMPPPAPAAIRMARCRTGHRDQLAERRTERGADLDDRPLTADRTAAADRESRSQRLDGRHDGPNLAVVIIDCIHHFADTMPFGLRRKGLHQVGHSHRAQNRHEDNQGAPRRRGGVKIRVVVEREAAEKEQVVKAADQVTEHHGSEAGD